MAQQKTAAELQKQLDLLRENIDKQGGRTKASEATLAAEKRITKELDRQKSLYEESLNTNKEIDDTLQSIASSFGKQSKIYKRTQAQLGFIDETVDNIVSASKMWNGSSEKNKKLLETQAKQYKNVNAQSLKNISLLGQGKAEQHEIIDALQDQIDLHEEALKSIDAKAKHSKKFKEEIQGEIDAMKKLQSATKSAAKDVEAINRMGSAFGGTLLGGGIDKTLKAFGKKDGLGGVIKSITDSRTAANGKGGVGGMFTKMLGGVSRFLGPIALAVGGIMAAAEFFDSGGAAKMAMRMAVLQGKDPMNSENVDRAIKQSKQYRDVIVDNTIKLPVRLRQQAESDFLGYRQGVEEDAAKYKESLISDEIDYRMSLESDAISFRQQQASAELDANLSRQKTLFTSAMGYMKGAIGVSERALQAIGSSTQAVLDTVKEYGYTLGIALKDQMALSAGAQGLAVRFGTSATEVFKMADTFRLMNKTSAKTGANLVAGLEDLAKKNDMSPAQLYKEMADAQADILKYSNYTTQEYAQQAILLGNMNTSMASMMKASDSMVLNYKDSIKAEMSLSAMLGKNVNFSEVRAKLMAGDQAGGAAALKTALGGQDINAMNAFQKQALSQATGMGIQELMQLTQSKGGGVKGTLAEKNAVKTGKDIAKGALSQDIANAAAKLALDQKNRAEMLKFEQAKRLAMLFVEQKFRLNAIEREFTYREQREKLGAEHALENLKVDMMADVASEQIMSLTNAYAGKLGKGQFDRGKVDAFSAETMKNENLLQQAMASKFIADSEIADIAMKRLDAAEKGKVFDVTQIAGVQRFQAAQAAEAKRQNDNNAKMIAAMENYVKIVNDPNSSMGKVALAKSEAMKYGGVFQKLEDFSDVLSSSVQKKKRVEFLGNLKKQYKPISVLPPGATIPGKGGKPTPVTVTTKSGTKTADTKPADVKLPANSPALTDSQSQIKLQSEMVTLLGLSTGFIKQLLEVTAADAGKTVMINGTKLNASLLENARKNYAVAGVTKY